MIGCHRSSLHVVGHAKQTTRNFPCSRAERAPSVVRLYRARYGGYIFGDVEKMKHHKTGAIVVEAHAGPVVTAAPRYTVQTSKPAR